MSLQINTNVTALNALNNLNKVSNSVASSIEKLSSGLRINRAADDPSGLIISESLRAQIDGLNQAVSNSQDATNLIKTSEGALTEVNSLLRNVRQLAVHAANTGVNDQVAVQADQTQITAPLPASSASPSRRSSEPSACSMARQVSPLRLWTQRTLRASTSAACSTILPHKPAPSTSR